VNGSGTIIPLFREIFRSTSQRISLAIILARVEEDFEVILGDFLSPSGLAAGEKSLCGKGLQVVVVSQDREGS